MKLSWHLFFQLLATVVQWGNLASGMTTGKTQAAVLLIVALAQAALGWWAHYSNPDGTPATVAFVPKP
ncbi:MAG: hypothetical protein ACLPLR_08740 [Terriglobales bacterium]